MNSKQKILRLSVVCCLWSVVCFSSFLVFGQDLFSSDQTDQDQADEDQADPDKIIPVVIDGDEINYLQAESKISAKGNVKMKYKTVELYCEEAVYDVNENFVYINGDVKIVRDGTVLYGKDIVYDFNTFNILMESVRIEDPPIYGVAESSEKQGEDKYVMLGAALTTCDLADPHYRLVAKRATIYPGDKVVAKNVVLKIGKVPVFYIPYFSQSLKDDAFQFDISPGKNKEWGYYLLTRWRYTLNDQNKGNLFLDWYDRRGTGIGIVNKMETKKFGEALIKFYSLEDKMYNIYHAEDRESLFDQYPLRKDLTDKRLEDDRYKAQISYSWKPNENLSIKAEYHKFSDDYFMKDFFEKEYDIEPRPKTYSLINYSMGNSSLSLFAKKRVNRFWSETEYLPQFEYNFYRQNLGETNFYFDSLDKFGNLNIQRKISGNENSLRFYSRNTLSYAGKIKWFQISPYITAHSSYYTRRSDFDDDLWRMTPGVGSGLSIKFYKYLNAGWSLFGQRVDKMRHVFTPEVVYGYVHKPTAPNRSVFQFDSSDSLARSESVVFRLKNKLQAKDDLKNEVWDFVYFSPSVSYTINKEGKGSYFNDVLADLEIYPTKNIGFGADSVYDLDTQKFLSVNTDLNIRGQTKVFEQGKEVERELYQLSLGHRYVRKGNSQGTLDLSYRVNPKLEFNSYIRYQYKTEDFDEQQYSIRQDLHCWIMDVGLNIDRHQRGGKNLTFWVAFTLKAFPDLGFDFDTTYKGAKPRPEDL